MPLFYIGQGNPVVRKQSHSFILKTTWNLRDVIPAVSQWGGGKQPSSSHFRSEQLVVVKSAGHHFLQFVSSQLLQLRSTWHSTTKLRVCPFHFWPCVGGGTKDTIERSKTANESDECVPSQRGCPEQETWGKTVINDPGKDIDGCERHTKRTHTNVSVQDAETSPACSVRSPGPWFCIIRRTVARGFPRSFHGLVNLADHRAGDANSDRSARAFHLEGRCPSRAYRIHALPGRGE